MNSAPRSTTAPANGTDHTRPPDPVARLEHVDLGPGPNQRVRGGQSRETRADDDHPHAATRT